MKIRLPILVLLLATARLLLAGSPTDTDGYVTATDTAQIIFPANPVKVIRLISINVTGDTNTSVLTLQSGLGTYYLTTAATNSDTNLIVASNSGLASNDVIVLQTPANVPVQATIYSVSTNGTNISLTSTLGVVASTNSTIWQMGNTRTLTIGSNTFTQTGEAIYVAPSGTPLRLQMSGASTYPINNATVAYTRVP